MARKPDTPCARCGKLLYGGSGSRPAGERICRTCRVGGPAPLVSAVTAGDHKAALEAIRHKLAVELDSAEGRDVPPLAKALMDVLKELYPARPAAAAQPEKPKGAVSGVISLADEVARRRPAATG